MHNSCASITAGSGRGRCVNAMICLGWVPVWMLLLSRVRREWGLRPGGLGGGSKEEGGRRREQGGGMSDTEGKGKREMKKGEEKGRRKWETRRTTTRTLLAASSPGGSTGTREAEEDAVSE